MLNRGLALWFSHILIYAQQLCTETGALKLGDLSSITGLLSGQQKSEDDIFWHQCPGS